VTNIGLIFSLLFRKAALRLQIMNYDLIIVPRRKYLGLATIVTEAKYIAGVLSLHYDGLAHTLYRLLHSP